MRITQQTKVQLGGSADRQVMALSLLQNETRKQLLIFKKDDVAVDITNFTFKYRMIQRSAEYVSDTKDGINIIGLGTWPGAVEVNLDTELFISNAAAGMAQLNFPTTLTSVEPSDPDSEMPVIYTGYINIDDNAGVGPLNQKIQILLLVSNDGV